MYCNVIYFYCCIYILYVYMSVYVYLILFYLIKYLQLQRPLLVCIWTSGPSSPPHDPQWTKSANVALATKHLARICSMAYYGILYLVVMSQTSLKRDRS